MLGKTTRTSARLISTTSTVANVVKNAMEAHLALTGIARV
jgi:hypothetical protein